MLPKTLPIPDPIGNNLVKIDKEKPSNLLMLLGFALVSPVGLEPTAP